jgi:SAM-dependent methyltransferase
MAHHAQHQFVCFVKEQFPHYFKNVKVLDVGSLDINGNNRQYFENADFTGIDVGEGRGVDVVCLGHEFTSETQFDTIISTECFEHDEFYPKTLINIVKLLKPEGLFVFTCASEGREEHGTTNAHPLAAPFIATSNYYKNLTEKDIRLVLEIDFVFREHFFQQSYGDLYFWGIKRNRYYG